MNNLMKKIIKFNQ